MALAVALLEVVEDRRRIRRPVGVCSPLPRSFCQKRPEREICSLTSGLLVLRDPRPEQ